MQIVEVQQNQLQRLELKKGMKDYREDLLAMIFFMVLFSLPLFLDFNNGFFRFVAIVAIIWNGVRFYYLQFGDFDHITYSSSNNQIEDQYNHLLLDIMPNSKLTVTRYGERQWAHMNGGTSRTSVSNGSNRSNGSRRRSSSSNSDSLVFGLIGALLEIIWITVKEVVMVIKPNTDYYQFMISKDEEGAANLFHLRTNDHTKMQELRESIATQLGLQLEYLEDREL